MRRYLDALEKPLLATTSGIHTLQYRGKLNEDYLREAFGDLCVKYPILSGRILKDDTDYLFDITESRTLNFFIIKEIVADLNKLRMKLDEIPKIKTPECPGFSVVVSHLARLILARSNSGGYVMLQVHHSITGGGTGLFYLRELWALYNNIIDGCGTPVTTKVALPRAPTELLRERWSSRAGMLPAISQEKSKKTSGLPAKRSVTKLVRLNQKESSKLFVNARSMKVSVNSLLIGELARALHEFEPSNSGLIRVDCFARLFNRLSPPVDAAETTYCIGHIQADVSVGETDAATIGREFKSKLDRSIQDRSVIIPGYTIPFGVNILKGVDIVWNGGAGRTPKMVSPAGLDIIDVLELNSYTNDVTNDLEYQSCRDRVDQNAPTNSECKSAENVTLDGPRVIAFSNYGCNGINLKLRALGDRKELLYGIEQRIREHVTLRARF